VALNETGQFAEREGLDLESLGYTAVIRRDGPWWIGWIEEVPGVNSQGATREELIFNLREALNEAIELNREDALKAAGESFEEVAIHR
jgi:predicted RNase H-like HicB family nuclease